MTGAVGDSVAVHGGATGHVLAEVRPHNWRTVCGRVETRERVDGAHLSPCGRCANRAAGSHHTRPRVLPSRARGGGL